MKLKKFTTFRILLTICLFMVFLSFLFLGIKASANQTIFKLTNVSISEKSENVISNVDSFDNDDIKLNLEFHKIDDYIIYKLNVKNTSSHDYTVKSITDNNTNSFISYEYDKHENEVVKAGNSLEVNLKVIYKNEQTDISSRDQIENFKLIFTFVNEDGEPVSGNIDINPKTFDNIYVYYIIAGVSLIVIAVLNIKFKNNKIKSIIITLIVLTPIVTKAADSSFNISLKSDTKLYDKLVVRYNLNGEEVTKIVKYGETFEKPANPSKTGYTFDGWYLNGKLYDFTKPITNDEVLVPKFTPNPTTYTVIHKYENINGTFTDISKTIDAVTDQEVTAPIISETGFTDPEAQNITVKYDGSSKVTYKYFRNTFNVKFNTNGGTNVDDITKKYEEQIGTLPSTEKDNFIFDAWYTTNDGNTKVNTTDEITSDVTYYARWKKSVYFAEIENSTLNLTRGNTSQINITNIDNIGEDILYESSSNGVATVSETGLITAVGKGNAVITIKGAISNITKEINVTVKNEDALVHFNTHGGSNVSDLTIENESAIGDLIPSNPTKEHFIFDDWYLTDEYNTKLTSETVVNGETTYHAKWNKTVYHAEFENSVFNIHKDATAQINITNASEIPENITYGTNNSNIATVDENGLITAHNEGTTTITITGATSNEVKTVTVNVTVENVTIHFDTHEGSGVSDVVIEKGTAIGNKIPAAPIKTHYIFDDWYLTDEYNNKVTSETVVNENTTFHAKWDKSVYFLDIQNDNITLTNLTDGAIVINNASEIKENYTFTSSDDNVVTVDNEGNLSALSVGTATITIEGITSLEQRTVSINVVPVKYTVSFNTHNSSTISSIEVDAGGTLTSIPTPSDDTKTFDGWFYNEDGTGDMLTTSTIINESHTYHAKWTGIICKKATSLHTESCNSASGKGCKGAGMTSGSTITYGSIVNSDTYVSGDAFDCDVDGSGYNQRFYYIRTLNNKAVLISNKNYTADSGQDNQNISFIYSQAHDQLPTVTNWGNLPELFDGKPARLITLDDIYAIAGTSDYNVLKNVGSLESYTFLFENSNYSGIGERSTQWVEEVSPTKRYRYRNDQRNLVIVESGKQDTSLNPVRPVIEVPLSQIENTYVVKFVFDVDSPSSDEIYRNITKGSKIGTFPSISKTNYSIVNWYKDAELTEVVDENTIPTGYDTYYCKWKLNADQAIYATKTYKLSENTTSQIVILNSDNVEPLVYVSDDESIATVDSEGVITAHSVGTTTITVEGTISHTSQTVNVTVSENTPKVTVSFDTHGGTSVDDIEIDINTVIGTMPTSTKDGYTLVGWYNNAQYDVEINGDNEILADVTLHARWMANDAVCEMNKEYFNNIQTAIDTAPTTKTTITLVKDVTLTSTIDLSSNTNDRNTKNIVLDFNNHMITYNTSNVIKTKTKLEVKNGTIETKAGSGAIDADGSNAYLVVNNMTIRATGTRQAIYNNGGTVIIKGADTYLSAKATVDSSNKRATVQTLSGTTRIEEGTIVSTQGLAVSASGGTVIIGTHDGVASSTSPIIIGQTYGVTSTVNIYFYDGIIKGIIDVFESGTLTPSGDYIETNYETEFGEDDEFKTFHLKFVNDKYNIHLETNGGTVDSDNIVVDKNSSIDSLPTPEKGVYHFDGWYFDDDTFENPVILPYTPDDSLTLYAKWSYEASDEIADFDMVSDAMRVYYTNISSWKNLDETTFKSNMLSNFNAKTCSSCNADNSCNNPLAGTFCEQSKGYNTGITDSVNVYNSSVTNKEKGSLVSYTTSDEGIIYNMIPGKVYYWESTVDNNIHGLVKATGERRTIKSSARNVRDLGGMAVSFTRNNATKTGTLKYGKLFRGAQLSGGQTDVDSILKLGVTREIDLRVKTEGNNPVRLPKHDKCDSNCSDISSSDDIIITNYLIYPDNKIPSTNATCSNCNSNFLALRQAMVDVMNYVISGDSLYFHCTIGTDRTGTIAYFLEGLLGVSEEDRVEDYELTYFFGLLNRDRYHDNLSSSSINPRFTTMHETYDTNEKIYNWFMYGLTDEEKVDMDTLIENFRDAMIDYN